MLAHSTSKLDRSLNAYFKAERPTPSPLANAEGLTKKVALRSVALSILKHGSIGYNEAATLYSRVCDEISLLISEHSGCDRCAPPTSNMVRLRAMLVATLPVVKVPFRKSGQVGMAPCVLVPNVPGILDGDLQIISCPCASYMYQFLNLGIPETR